jgi:hypothetical protein
MNSYAWYASLRGLSQNTIVPSFGYIDILPLGLCLIDIVCLDNAGILLCLLWPYRYFASWAICLLGYSASWACLLGYFASWATFPLGLLCLLGYFASWACLLGYFASWATLPLGLLCLLGYLSTFCLLGHVSSILFALTMPVYWYASWVVPSLGTC